MFAWLPTRAAVIAALAGLAAALLAWLRADARRDAAADQEKKDFDHAADITAAAADARRDHADGVQPYDNAGWRD